MLKFVFPTFLACTRLSYIFAFALAGHCRAMLCPACIQTALEVWCRCDCFATSFESALTSRAAQFSRYLTMHYIRPKHDVAATWVRECWVIDDNLSLIAPSEEEGCAAVKLPYRACSAVQTWKEGRTSLLVACIVCWDTSCFSWEETESFARRSIDTMCQVVMCSYAPRRLVLRGYSEHRRRMNKRLYGFSQLSFVEDAGHEKFAYCRIRGTYTAY
jgi:hypothetical protein